LKPVIQGEAVNATLLIQLVGAVADAFLDVALIGQFWLSEVA